MMNAQHETPKLEHSAGFRPIQSEALRSKLIQHEPCIHTLKYLEAKVEKQKQMVKVKADQMQALRQQSVRQRMEITQLREESKSKDHAIQLLRSQIGVEHQSESSDAKVFRLKAVIRGQREELERIRLANQMNRLKQDSLVKLKEVNPHESCSVKGSRDVDVANKGAEQPNGALK